MPKLGSALNDPPGEGGIPSNPPSGKKKITNVYWDPDTEEIVVDHET